MAPTECICPESHANAIGEIVKSLANVPQLSQRPDWTFDPKTAKERSPSQALAVATFAGLVSRISSLALACRAPLCAGNAQTSVQHIRRCRLISRQFVLQLDDDRAAAWS